MAITIEQMRESRELMIPPEWRGQEEGEISLMDTAKDVMEALIEHSMDMDAAAEWLCMRDGVEVEEMDEYAQRAFEYYAHNFTQRTLEWLINNIDLKEGQEAIEDESLPRGHVVTCGDGRGNLERRVGTGPPLEGEHEDEDE
jgi:acetyl-CoA acetyltransferase